MGSLSRRAFVFLSTACGRGGWGPGGRAWLGLSTFSLDSRSGRSGFRGAGGGGADGGAEVGSPEGVLAVMGEMAEKLLAHGPGPGAVSCCYG